LVGVSFGMMFGSRPGNSEEWSTEDEADVEELDDEEDEEEEEEDDEEYYDSDGEEQEHINPDGTIWEPPAKHYSHMNLKEEASKERQSKMSEETEKDNELLEAKRKLKNAKKRVEKRRKQKEKKMRELAVKEEEEGQLRQIEEAKLREEEEAAAKAENDLKYVDIYPFINFVGIESPYDTVLHDTWFWICIILLYN
jgi:flagellar motor protein MotB